jgi:hypothetical protein
LDQNDLKLKKLMKNIKNTYCLYQWRSQEFLSSGQFPSQTILRSGQPWAIEKQLGYSFFKTFYLYKS